MKICILGLSERNVSGDEKLEDQLFDCQLCGFIGVCTIRVLCEAIQGSLETFCFGVIALNMSSDSSRWSILPRVDKHTSTMLAQCIWFSIHSIHAFKVMLPIGIGFGLWLGFERPMKRFVWILN